MLTGGRDDATSTLLPVETRLLSVDVAPTAVTLARVADVVAPLRLVVGPTPVPVRDALAVAVVLAAVVLVLDVPADKLVLEVLAVVAGLTPVAVLDRTVVPVVERAAMPPVLARPVTLAVLLDAVAEDTAPAPAPVRETTPVVAFAPAKLVLLVLLLLLLEATPVLVPVPEVEVPPKEARDFVVAPVVAEVALLVTDEPSDLLLATVAVEVDEGVVEDDLDATPVLLVAAAPAGRVPGGVLLLTAVVAPAPTVLLVVVAPTLVPAPTPVTGVRLVARVPAVLVGVLPAATEVLDPTAEAAVVLGATAPVAALLAVGDIGLLALLLLTVAVGERPGTVFTGAFGEMPDAREEEEVVGGVDRTGEAVADAVRDVVPAERDAMPTLLLAAVLDFDAEIGVVLLGVAADGDLTGDFDTVLLLLPTEDGVVRDVAPGVDRTGEAAADGALLLLVGVPGDLDVDIMICLLSPAVNCTIY